MSLGTLGRTCCAGMDDMVSWQDRLAQLTRAMTAFPVAPIFVQHSNFYASSWSELPGGRRRLPYVEEYLVRYDRHLNGRDVPDAYGLQLLTDAHLAIANDLSDWVIEPLREGKYLVLAQDLEPWYATIGPDAGTLAKARAGFGGMILTPEIIGANPPPWR